MIHPQKYYTPQELEDLGKEGFFPLKEKLSIIRLIESGQLPAINASVSLKKRKFWKIKGEDILKFLDLRGTYSLSKEETWKPDEKDKLTKIRKSKEDSSV